MLRLTPAALEGAYEYLRVTTPFKGWRLPHADDVEFHIGRTRVTMGHHRCDKRSRRTGHEIMISEVMVGSTDMLMRIMGHEMVHLFQEWHGFETPGVEHNADFLKRAAAVCRSHVFDPRAFV